MNTTNHSIQPNNEFVNGVETNKKTWQKPELKVISKENIRSGATPTTYESFPSAKNSLS